MSGEATSNRICPHGRWVELSFAKKSDEFTINVSNITVTLAERLASNDMSVVLERHKTSQHGAFASFSFVYIHPDHTMNASANMVLTKNDWVKMCIHFSDKNNIQRPDPKIAAQFEEYTGMAAIPLRIKLAFKLKVLTSKQTLEEILEERKLSIVHELQRSMAARASTCTKGIFATDKKRNRLINAPNVRFRESIGITIDSNNVARWQVVRLLTRSTTRFAESPPLSIWTNYS